MIKRILIVCICICLSDAILFAKDSEEHKSDTLTFKQKQEIVVTATRLPIPNKEVSMANSLVLYDVLKTTPRGIGAEEAFRLVPGVRIDNQANGSRVHMSIRGQGILTERGLRGINVIVDGIPFNDPSGFAPDLFDVDWNIIDRIEVLRGPTASYYGGGGAAGVLNIFTKSGNSGGLGGFNKEVSFEAGSYGFMKGLGEVDGKTDNLDYRITFSKMKGDGYRNHSAYWGNNMSEKINWKASDKLSITQIFMLTDYFNQNAEGLSIDQVNKNPKQANPDAVPFNEYQKTNRITNGIVGQLKISDIQDLLFNGYMRWSKYKETSNKAAQYRNFTSPGGGIQYNLHLGSGDLKHNISVGTEFRWQGISENKYKSLNDTTRKDDGTDDTNIEDTTILANQTIDQNMVGAYVFYNLGIGNKLFFNASLRYDKIHNELADKLNVGTALNQSDNADFDKVTGKIGATYAFSDELSLYANWGSGFIPPATEELANNPASFSGYNKNLSPATSSSEEVGFRGYIGNIFTYDVTGFYMTTDKDFFRFKLYPARGNQEVFYGNAGSSKRMGLETFLAVKPTEKLNIQLAYTYSNFKYDSPDSLKDVWVPNSPQHQFNLDAEYEITKDLTIGVNADMQSKWYIYPDSSHKNIVQDGFTLIGARIQYKFEFSGLDGTIALYGRNLGGTKYIAFTEPDPDGNCYQPGPLSEYFVNLKIHF